MLVMRISAISGKTHIMDLPVTEEQLAAWESGTLIQNAMPNLTPDEREFVKTGVTKEEWEDMFGVAL